MRRATKTNLALMVGAFALGLVATLFLLREPMQPLDAQSLAAARLRWRDAGVTDYDLTYRMHGSLYVIEVRRRIVTHATVDGQRPRTGDLGAYSVDGLFDTLALELENLTDPAGPFAGRSGTVLMRVRFNAELGYLERYLRTGGGRRRGVSIELFAFAPK